jgi:hypothetical protein
MSKDPAHRPQTALALAQHFQRIEQELRLARTEIVVLEHGHVDPVVPVPVTDLDATDVQGDVRRTGPNGTRPDITAPQPNAADMAATELKPPPRVAAQSPVPPASPAAPAAGAPAWRGATNPPGIFEKATDLRPPRVEPTAAPSVEPEPEVPGGRTRWKLIAAGVVVAALAVAGGFILSNGSGNKSSGTTQQPPVDNHLPGTTQLTLTAITGVHVTSSTATTVTFAWPKVQGASGYAWAYATGTDPSLHGVAEPKARVKRLASGKTCVTVTYAKAGQYGPASAQACE